MFTKLRHKDIDNKIFFFEKKFNLQLEFRCKLNVNSLKKYLLVYTFGIQAKYFARQNVFSSS